ncbi:Uncharacterized membrane protein YphA, DoxX/SURF4 family [Hymenobacter gelipurpurascens]|uniref:Uncharacterized membrane protein YphA, DoxX/SURF4 family n=1 Tax=Hymenobacter gelipurpurascens TaxID=89968 RepID=A0A212TQA1_9BACT|nr:DoxX family protein [Hymenobacter gelipurpurascens]SNC68208.1 Uncharacterized membrane protein YphA, DoxX/SURF4 family [Hymenobacter gelipurpurascens]
MELSHRIPLAERKDRTSANNPVWMDALRILLGLFLFIKGVTFLDKSTDVYYLLTQQQTLGHLSKASFFFSIFQMIGGLMIAFGALTRFAFLCQIPIMLGAIFIVNLRNGLSLHNMELWVSVVVLVLCVVFMIVGPGRFSVDNKIFRQPAKRS